MRRWNKVIFLGVTCLALAGCGKDRGDELAKDYQKNDELASDTSADADITGHLTYELVSDSGITFTVDADATGGGKLAESHCYGAKPVEVDEAYLKEYVYTIFDEGTLQQVKPYEVCSQQELANRQNQLLQRQQELQLQTDTENSSVHALWEKGIMRLQMESRRVLLAWMVKSMRFLMYIHVHIMTRMHILIPACVTCGMICIRMKRKLQCGRKQRKMLWRGWI